jgi:hypothetical protein
MAKKTTQSEILETLQQQNAAILGALQGLTEALTNRPKQPKEEIDVKDVSVTSTPKKGMRGRPKKAEAQEVSPKINRLNGKPFVDFSEFDEFDAEKKDTIIDEKLWGKRTKRGKLISKTGRAPQPRGGRQSRILVNCDSCNKECRVSPEEIGSESSYKCNKCIVKGKSR